MSATLYPERLAIAPMQTTGPRRVRVPGSKSITNRALVLAALTVEPGRPCRLEGALRSEDTVVMVDSLDRLGFEVTPDWTSETILVARSFDTPKLPRNHASLDVANSGTTMRFLTAMVALGQGTYRLDGIARMRERPIADLLAALDQLGIKAWSETDNGCPPVMVVSDGLRGGQVRIRGDISSQFLSGLLMAVPFAAADTTIEVDGPLVSVPYIDMTLTMMRQFGLRVDNEAHRRYRVPARQSPPVMPSYRIEPDASAASYFLGAAAILGNEITVAHLGKVSMQGDVAFADLLAKMGCRVMHRGEDICVEGARLHGIDVDMNAISDTVMTLAAVACFADSPTTIRNVAHIRHKETDRLAALALELRRVGAVVDEFPDGLRITPAPLHGTEIETYNDHRMAMSMALIGLVVPGIVIKNPGCVAKTYPDFFRDLEYLR